MLGCLGSAGKARSNSSSDLSPRLDEPEQPLLQGTVALVGWFGCDERYLAKYANWWQSQGWHPVLLLLKSKFDALFERAGQRNATAFLERLAASQAEVVERGGSARLLFHVFSMAGWMLFGVMLRDMATRSCAPHLSDICGLVVDSAPMPTVCTRTMAAGVLAALNGSKKRINQHSASFRLMRAFFQVWVPRSGSRYRTLEAIMASTRKLASFPQVYIYSAADDVVRCTSIEGYIWDERRRERVVRALRFGDTPHCGHFRGHRAEYTLALQRFLSEDLKASPGAVEPIPAAAAALGAAQEHAREAGSLLGSDAEEATSSQARPCQGFAKVAEDGSMQHQPDVHRGAVASGLPSPPPSSSRVASEASAGSTPRPRTPDQSIAALPTGC